MIEEVIQLPDLTLTHRLDPETEATIIIDQLRQEILPDQIRQEIVLQELQVRGLTVPEYLHLGVVLRVFQALEEVQAEAVVLLAGHLLVVDPVGHQDQVDHLDQVVPDRARENSLKNYK